MNLANLSSSSELPILVIGLDLTNETVNRPDWLKIRQVFHNVDDCENFIQQQTNDMKTVVIIFGHVSSTTTDQLKSYLCVEAIYLFTPSADPKEQLKCAYTKTSSRHFSERSTEFLKKFWFLLGLCMVMVLAAAFPDLGASGGPLHTEYTLKWGGVMFIFFMSGLSLPTETLTNELFHFRLHIFTQLFSFVFIPFTVFGVCLLLAQTSFNKIFISGIISMACTSTTISSNVSRKSHRSANVKFSTI